MAELPAPTAEMGLTHFIVSSDVDRARRFYADVPGGEVVRDGWSCTMPQTDDHAGANIRLIGSQHGGEPAAAAARVAPTATAPGSRG
jgi:hypothetical protein